MPASTQDLICVSKTARASPQKGVSIYKDYSRVVKVEPTVATRKETPARPRQEEPVVTVPENADPSQLQSYPPAVRDIIERAKQFSHCDIASVNSFPLRLDFNQKAVEYINKAIAEQRGCGLPVPDGNYSTTRNVTTNPDFRQQDGGHNIQPISQNLCVIMPLIFFFLSLSSSSGKTSVTGVLPSRKRPVHMSVNAMNGILKIVAQSTPILPKHFWSVETF